MLDYDSLLNALRAIGETTRFRIVVLLKRGELSVTDLTEILGQSQPRISRHLKLLADAEVIERHREGNFVFFSLATDGDVRRLVDNAIDTLDPLDPIIAADLNRLDGVLHRRTAAAQEYFANIAHEWDEVRSLHAPDSLVEATLVDALSDRAFASVLDVGTGTGRILQVLAQSAALQRAVGLDTSHSMLAVARANLDRAGISGVELRQGNIGSPPFEPESFELVVIHQVLHFLDDPDRAIAAAARLVAPGGQLVIVDFAPHELGFLQRDHAHRRLGFRTETINSWLTNAGLDVSDTRTVAPTDNTDQSLTVSLWLATSPAKVLS